VEHAFDADHGVEESKPDVDGGDVELDAGMSVLVDDDDRVMCGEASGDGAKIGVEAGVTWRANCASTRKVSPGPAQSSARGDATAHRSGVVAQVILSWRAG